MKSRPSKNAWWIVGVLTAMAVLASAKLGFNLSVLKSLGTEMGPSLSKYSRPAWQDLPRLLKLLAETVAMGVVGSVIALVLGLPAVAFASRNISPNRFLNTATRQVLNFFRSMPDALIALLLVQGLGMGPMTGAIALGLHMSGFVGKTLSEKVERVNPGVIEGLHSCGAGWFQVFRFGALPSIEREIIADSLYIVDRNIRTAATLGLVGAGGIGVELLSDLRTFHEQEAATVIVMIIVLVVAVDTASTHLRKRLA